MQSDEGMAKKNKQKSINIDDTARKFKYLPLIGW